MALAGQRRSEPRGNDQRRRRRSRRLAALLLIAVSVLPGLACDGGARVVGFGTSGGNSGGTGGGTGAGGAALVGSWRNVSTLMLSSGGTLVLDVRWSFDAGGGCSRTRIQTIVNGNSGTETSDTILCTYTVSGSTVTVMFQGSSVASRFSFALSGGDLLLAGTRFSRTG